MIFYRRCGGKIVAGVVGSTLQVRNGPRCDAIDERAPDIQVSTRASDRVVNESLPP
jgi:hypothetical protein